MQGRYNCLHQALLPSPSCLQVSRAVKVVCEEVGQWTSLTSFLILWETGFGAVKSCAQCFIKFLEKHILWFILCAFLVLGFKHKSMLQQTDISNAALCLSE